MDPGAELPSDLRREREALAERRARLLASARECCRTAAELIEESRRLMDETRALLGRFLHGE
jgi:hypothetical protein